MSNATLRIQFISDKEAIGALAKVAADNAVTTEPFDVPSSDQAFGIVEVAAIIGIVHTAAQIAELLVKTYKSLKGKKKIVVKTPKGSVTIEADSTTPVDDIAKMIKQADIV